MCLNGIFLIQLCVHLSLWTRLSLMKCHPKFLRHNPTPLKRIYMEFNATKVNFSEIFTCLDILYQSNRYFRLHPIRCQFVVIVLQIGRFSNVVIFG